MEWSAQRLRGLGHSSVREHMPVIIKLWAQIQWEVGIERERRTRRKRSRRRKEEEKEEEGEKGGRGRKYESWR